MCARCRCGYNAAGNRTFAWVKQYPTDDDGDLQTPPTPHENDRSSLYAYDALQRLIDVKVGRLSGDRASIVTGVGVPEPMWTAWKLNNLGNWPLTRRAALPRRRLAAVDSQSQQRVKGWSGDANNESVVTRADSDGDGEFEFVRSLHHDVNSANEIMAINERLEGQEPPPDPTTIHHDPAGNLVCDGTYYYQYDAWNRLVQVNLIGTAGIQADGRLLIDPLQGMTLGDLVCRHAYDAMGRLMWRRTPTSEGFSQLQRKDYYYDGVRRIQENIARPSSLSQGGGGSGGGGGGGGGGTPAGPEQLGGPGNDELPMQLLGGGLPPPLDPPGLECEEPELINTLRWTDREYVYGPGYVDEFILQIDQSGNILYMLQDANYNVVAIISGGCGPGVPPENCGTGGPPVGTVLEQYAYEPYGTVIAADNLDVDQYGVTRHAVNRVGFQGLFFERYDGSYFEPSIAPGVAGMYYARNRFYSPALGRFLQRDPNETGIPIIAALAMNGEATFILFGGFDASALYGDGMNLYLFAGANPVNSRDPLGLDFQDDIDYAISAYYGERSAFAVQLGQKMAKVGTNILWGTNIALLSILFPPLGVALGALGASNAILDIRDEGLTFYNAFDLASNLALSAASSPAAFAQIERGIASTGKLFRAFAKQEQALTTAYRGGARDYEIISIPGGCFVAGTLVLLGTDQTAPIEQIVVGQIVVSRADPLLSGTVDAAPVAGESWREIHLRIERADGATTEAYMLRSDAWVDSVGAAVGNTIHIDLPEMDIYGPACVVYLSPRIDAIETDSAGRSIVSGRFVTSNAVVLDLYLEGQESAVGTTAVHPFWSLDRNIWVPAGDLRVGERLGTREGSVTVLAVAPRRARTTVYNLEIHRGHTYYVCDAKVWVHNNCMLTPTRIKDVFGQGQSGAAYLGPDGTAYVAQFHFRLQEYLRSRGLWKSLSAPGEPGWYYGIVDKTGKFQGSPI